MTQEKGEITLGAFFTGDAEFQSFHGILSRLAERGRLKIRTFAYSRTFREFPYSKEYLETTSYKPNVRLKRTYELFPKFWLKGVDALLVIQDPLHDNKNPRRCRMIIKNNLPTILLGHSVISRTVICHRASSNKKPKEFYSGLIYDFEDIPEYYSVLSATTRSKIRVSGITKRFHITPKVSRYRELLEPFQRTLLFAHEFRTKRFTESEMHRYFEMVILFAKDNPNDAVIMRPHRGRAKSWHRRYDIELRKNCSNVFFSNHNSGLFKGAMVNDLLKVSDFLISTPSTAIVDAVYLKTPAAVTLNDDARFNDLAQVNDISSLNKFLLNTDAYSNIYARIRDKYGNIEANIEKTCEEIEQFLINLPRRN